jgi:hypothetical protein
MKTQNLIKSSCKLGVFCKNPACTSKVNKNSAIFADKSQKKVPFPHTTTRHEPRNHDLLSTHCAHYPVFFGHFSQLANAKDKSQKLVSENEMVPGRNLGGERALIYEGIYIKHNIITKKNHTKFEFIIKKLEKKARERLFYIAFLKNLCLLQIGFKALSQRALFLARTIKTGFLGIKNGLLEHCFSNI